MHSFYLYGISLHVLEGNTHTHDCAPNIDVIHILLFKFDSLLFEFIASNDLSHSDGS